MRANVALPTSASIAPIRSPAAKARVTFTSQSSAVAGTENVWPSHSISTYSSPSASIWAGVLSMCAVLLVVRGEGHSPGTGHRAHPAPGDQSGRRGVGLLEDEQGRRVVVGVREDRRHQLVLGQVGLVVGDVTVDRHLRLVSGDEAPRVRALAGLERDLDAFGAWHRQLPGGRPGPDQTAGDLVVLQRREGHGLLVAGQDPTNQDPAPRVVGVVDLPVA